MNLKDIALIYKPQSPVVKECSSHHKFIMEHNKQVQDIIAESHLYGNVSTHDLSVNYQTSVKKINEYVANYKPVEIGDYSEYQERVINLSKVCLCSNIEIAARTGLPVVVVSAVLK